MNRALRTDFLMLGLAMLPPGLALGGHPGAAILLFVPLLLAACLHGAWEQIESARPATTPRRPAGRPAGALARLP